MLTESAGAFLKLAAPFLGSILAAAGLAFGYYQWRKAQLRRDDVLRWSNDAIAVLTTLHLICQLKSSGLSPSRLDERLWVVFFDTSILIEKGRLFFRNASPHRYGTQKQSAYRGLRPTILDPLVVAHKIAQALLENEEELDDITSIAEASLKNFVSLAQKEVGRERTAAADSSKGGESQDLQYLVASLENDRHDRLRNNSRSSVA